MSRPFTTIDLTTHACTHTCSASTIACAAGQGQVLVRVCALVQAAIGCCILLLLVSKMALILCKLCWWCFSFIIYHQLTQ